MILRPADSSTVTRCTRPCFQCPICAGPAQVGEVQSQNDSNLLSAETQSSPGPYALFCQYCTWSSSEIGIELERSSGVPAQLAKLNNGGKPKITYRDVRDRRKENPSEPPLPDELMDAELQFAQLKNFYQSHVSDGSSGMGRLSLGGEGMGLQSPVALTRIMSLYTHGRGKGGMQQGPPNVMPEALNTDSGLKLAQLDESAAIKKLMNGGWEDTASMEQRLGQQDPVARFLDELRPLQRVLRTKRSKRCTVCRHIISKPENKVASTRFKIRLVAKSYVPSITIKPLKPLAPPLAVADRPGKPEEPPMKPLKTYQYILTFNNPLFEKIKVSLATPNVTPGRFSSNVTLLCPQFEVDANTDMWDDALRDDADKKNADDGDGQAEVGKIFERGRNWVSVVLEVVPPSLRIEDGKGPLKEDEDILEIPMFVRMEWEGEAQNDDLGSSLANKDKDAKERRELAYWCVLGVGRISRD